MKGCWETESFNGTGAVLAVPSVGVGYFNKQTLEVIQVEDELTCVAGFVPFIKRF